MSRFVVPALAGLRWGKEDGAAASGPPEGGTPNLVGDNDLPPHLPTNYRDLTTNRVPSSSRNLRPVKSATSLRMWSIIFLAGRSRPAWTILARRSVPYSSPFSSVAS